MLVLHPTSLRWRIRELAGDIGLITIKVSTQLQNEFILFVRQSGKVLGDLGFHHHSTERYGYATCIDYKRDDTVVTFMLGPSDWHVEILVTTGERQYGFKDLLEIPCISDWTKINQSETMANGTIRDNVKEEVIWFTRLIDFSLTKI